MCAMSRREFLGRSMVATLGLDLRLRRLSAIPKAERFQGTVGQAAGGTESVLEGTARLEREGDLALEMVDGIHRYLLRRTEEVVRERSRLWNRDYRSVEDYERSIAPNRERFRQIIGVVDRRVDARVPDLAGTVSVPAQVAQGAGYKALAVRWGVLEPVTADFGGLDAEGLLLEPKGAAVARIVAIPDADWTPEMLVGLAPGVPAEAQFARRLAENGCQVMVPLLLSRDDAFSGIPGIRLTNEPYREWVYRMAFEVGRHVVGLEVQKVLAAVDWFESENLKRRRPIGVMGYGEGGLVALYSAASDPRIEATVVSGYFGPREVWKEPIYRDVWGLVREFGDAEIASLIAPRPLIVEASRGPEVAGPPPATEERNGQACPNGRLGTPPLILVKSEVDRARSSFAGLKAEERLHFVVSEEGNGLPGSESALRAFFRLLGLGDRLRRAGRLPADACKNFDPTPRLHRQFDQMVGFTQALIRKSPDRRKEFWAKTDTSSPQRWKETSAPLRDYIWGEVIGRMPRPSLPPNPRTRLIFDEPKFRGYEVMLDVWPEVFAYGILLRPKDIQPEERRPVVVCQHGLEGRPRDVADPKINSHSYHRFAVRLAEEGFVTYAPQNPYIGEDRFRIIQRMGHPLKLALFSFIIGQHEQLLDWLATLPFVDPERIGFYGLSYGGKTAVRVPPFLEKYALSICSADFNEWVWKTTNVLSRFSYLLSMEYDMYEFNFANVANYAELACLMAPRPFMVERGHDDGVSTDSWVAHEFAKVREFYDKMGVRTNAEIEFFNGPHTINGVGTFRFLRQHLLWPK